MRYPLILTPDDNGTCLVTSPDFPELVSYGTSEADALDHGRDALETVIAHRISSRETVPGPSAGSATFADLPAIVAAKIGLHHAMLDQNVRKANLARKLGCHLPQIDRLLDIRHMSRLDHIEAALRALGRKLEIGVAEAA